MRDIRTEEMVLNMGPQHPSTHGVFRVVVRPDGEMVLETQSHVGYLHRCFEKCAENLTYIQVLSADALAAQPANQAVLASRLQRERRDNARVAICVDPGQHFDGHHAPKFALHRQWHFDSLGIGEFAGTAHRS